MDSIDELRDDFILEVAAQIQAYHRLEPAFPPAPVPELACLWWKVEPDGRVILSPRFRGAPFNILDAETSVMTELEHPLGMLESMIRTTMIGGLDAELREAASLQSKTQPRRLR